MTDKVYSFKKKNFTGFTKDEIETLLEEFPDVNKDKFNDAMIGNACPIIDGEIIYYTYDVAAAIEKSLEPKPSIVCKNCGTPFKEWTLTEPCGLCDDGVMLRERDGDHYYGCCYSCDGKGEHHYKQNQCCSEKCIEDNSNIKNIKI